MKSQEKAKVEPMVEKMQECARKFRAETVFCLMLASYDKGVFVACGAGSLDRADVNLVSKLFLLLMLAAPSLHL
jgi:hypothetical protein